MEYRKASLPGTKHRFQTSLSAKPNISLTSAFSSAQSCPAQAAPHHCCSPGWNGKGFISQRARGDTHPRGSSTSNPALAAQMRTVKPAGVSENALPHDPMPWHKHRNELLLMLASNFIRNAAEKQLYRFSPLSFHHFTQICVSVRPSLPSETTRALPALCTQ